MSGPRAGPSADDDRTSGDRTSGDRTSGDRASGDRASGDRASGDRARVAAARRVVVKIGSGVLTREGRFAGDVLSRLARELAEARAAGRQLVVVSSGAIALGVDVLGLPRRPRDIAGLQAAAAVGQARLVDRWSRAFARHGALAAQVLLTHADLHARTRYLAARHTLGRLLLQGAIPVINENDSVAVEEIRVGDNDLLAGLVTGLVGADLLVLLTDIDGVYTGDPRVDPDARRLGAIDPADPAVLAAARRTRTAVGTGGMATKVRAAAMAADLGVPAVIAGGRRRGVLARVLAGDDEGTLVRAGAARLTGRKGWLAHATRPRGRVVVDAGARRALEEHHSSLLPSGVRAVEGRFDEGDPVTVVDEAGAVFAVGLTSYGAEALRRIAGRRTWEIAGILGFRTLDEVIHRDDLVLTG